MTIKTLFHWKMRVPFIIYKKDYNNAFICQKYLYIEPTGVRQVLAEFDFMERDSFSPDASWAL